MKTHAVALLILSGALLFGPPASASDELSGALIGAGAGALIGQAIDRHDGAVVGGILGAVLGAAIADDDDHAPPRHHFHHRPAYAPVWSPPPGVHFDRPPMNPVFVHDGRGHPPGHAKHWQDRDDWRGDRYDDRGPGRGRDDPRRDDRGRDDRDGRRGGW